MCCACGTPGRIDRAFIELRGSDADIVECRRAGYDIPLRVGVDDHRGFLPELPVCLAQVHGPVHLVRYRKFPRRLESFGQGAEPPLIGRAVPDAAVQEAQEIAAAGMGDQVRAEPPRLVILRTLAVRGGRSIGISSVMMSVPFPSLARMRATPAEGPVQSGNTSCFHALLVFLLHFNGLAKGMWLPCRGRNTGYPAPPAQIPASGFPAPGSCLR